VSIPTTLVAEAERVARIQNNVVDKLAAIPGVTSVGFASAMPMEGFGSSWDVIFAEDKAYPTGEIPPLRFYKYVSPGFFHAAGTRLVAGRELTWTEIHAVRPVVLVSENLARELWGTPSAAIGKRIREFPAMPWHEVVGVIQNVPEHGIQEKTPETVYWPSMLNSRFLGPGPKSAVRTVTFVIRSERSGTEAFLNEVRHAVWSENASLPVASVLGIIGIYGVISYAVSQRTREIGIRLALGAQPGELRGMFVRHALALAGIGVAIGTAAAAGLTRLMASLLFGISALDPMTYAAVPVVLVAASVLASYLPARRAAAVDPVEALRAE
jgi:hypothetical protein